MIHHDGMFVQGWLRYFDVANLFILGNLAYLRFTDASITADLYWRSDARGHYSGFSGPSCLTVSVISLTMEAKRSPSDAETQSSLSLSPSIPNCPSIFFSSGILRDSFTLPSR